MKRSLWILIAIVLAAVLLGGIALTHGPTQLPREPVPPTERRKSSPMTPTNLGRISRRTLPPRPLPTQGPPVFPPCLKAGRPMGRSLPVRQPPPPMSQQPPPIVPLLPAALFLPAIRLRPAARLLRAVLSLRAVPATPAATRTPTYRPPRIPAQTTPILLCQRKNCTNTNCPISPCPSLQ